MLWLITIAAGGMGFALGLWRRRVHAVIASSAGIVVACSVLAPLLNWSPLTAAIYVLGMLTALQTGYLAGFAVHCGRSRAASWLARERDQKGRDHHA